MARLEPQLITDYFARRSIGVIWQPPRVVRLLSSAAARSCSPHRSAINASADLFAGRIAEQEKAKAD
ncbi:hypothetical protein CJ307_32850 [Klebsiella quasipneumoniae]|nr:hypothetical protein CJ307_32850 [Klebsiella quasipneumoniae]